MPVVTQTLTQDKIVGLLSHYDGDIKWSEWVAIAAWFGIHENIFRRRVRTQKMTPRKALLYDQTKGRKQFKFLGRKMYLGEISNITGYSPLTLRKSFIEGGEVTLDRHDLIKSGRWGMVEANLKIWEYENSGEGLKRLTIEKAIEIGIAYENPGGSGRELKHTKQIRKGLNIENFIPLPQDYVNPDSRPKYETPSQMKSRAGKLIRPDPDKLVRIPPEHTRKLTSLGEDDDVVVVSDDESFYPS